MKKGDASKNDTNIANTFHIQWGKCQERLGITWRERENGSSLMLILVGNYRGGLTACVCCVCVYSSDHMSVVETIDKMDFYGAIQRYVSIMIMCGNFNSYFVLSDKPNRLSNSSSSSSTWISVQIICEKGNKQKNEVSQAHASELQKAIEFVVVLRHKAHSIHLVEWTNGVSDACTCR